MIIRIQFVKLFEQNVKIIHPWAVFTVPENDSMSRVFNKIKEGKKMFMAYFTRLNFIRFL